VNNKRINQNLIFSPSVIFDKMTAPSSEGAVGYANPIIGACLI
jgi:hypothetical protein